MREHIAWEDIRIYREMRQIQQNQIKWVQEQFNDDRGKKSLLNSNNSNEKIKIEVFETMNAIEKMGKKKATSCDEVMDIIFQKKYLKKMYNRLKNRN